MKQKRIYDVSLTIHPGMLVWPGDLPVNVGVINSIEKGDSSNLSALHMGSHSGTHVDAPRHFIAGARGVDSMKPEVLLGKARLFQLPDAQRLDGSLFKNLDLRGVTRLLLGTRNSIMLGKPGFDLNYVSVTEDGARYLVERGIELLGVDYLSVEEFHKEGHAVHKTLLRAEIVVIEGLDLSKVPGGDYELICAPLKVKDADGAPARVFLRQL